MKTPRERELEKTVRLQKARIDALEKIIALYRQWRMAPIAKTRPTEGPRDAY